MSTLRRPTRYALGLLAVAGAVGCCLLVGALGLDRVDGAARDLVVALAWATGLAATVLAVAAAQEHTDPDDDPRYLETIVHGFVDEWRR